MQKIQWLSKKTKDNNINNSNNSINIIITIITIKIIKILTILIARELMEDKLRDIMVDNNTNNSSNIICNSNKWLILQCTILTKLKLGIIIK